MSILSIWPFITGVALTPTPARLSTSTLGGFMMSYPEPPSYTSIDSSPPKNITSPDL